MSFREEKMGSLVNLCMEVHRSVEKWSGRKKKCWWKSIGIHVLVFLLQPFSGEVEIETDKQCKNR